MAALGRELIRQPDRLAPLFTPAFDKTARNPGYIKGYPPGIRENGGQYNHAAAWSVMASASLGDGDQAALLFSFLNPISRSLTADAVARYKVEPYVVVADIYTEAPHIGRGGWSWYTGSAGWLQRAGIETILGLRLSGASLRLTPCIPRHWPGFSIDLAWRSAHYHIQIENGPGALVVEASLDGVALPAGPLIVALQDDGEQHRIQVKLG
jgi:cyclic beta-1,2-glucan synthetase